MLYYTGLRDAAICGIRLRDLAGPETLQDGRVVFGKLRTTGKGDKESVKAVHPELWTVLEKYVESRSREDRVPEAPLFAKRDGTPWSPRMIQDRVAAWGANAGVSPCVPHRFRHTFATNLLESTGDVRLVQKALDHASLATTQIYTEVVDRRMQDAIGSLPSFTTTLPETIRPNYPNAFDADSPQPGKPVP